MGKRSPNIYQAKRLLEEGQAYISRSYTHKKKTSHRLIYTADGRRAERSITYKNPVRAAVVSFPTCSPMAASIKRLQELTSNRLSVSEIAKLISANMRPDGVQVATLFEAEAAAATSLRAVDWAALPMLGKRNNPFVTHCDQPGTKVGVNNSRSPVRRFFPKREELLG